jgi:putative transposase
MPAKNTIRKFAENSFYHIYNRGVEKRTIFIDKQDYKIFLHFLKYYLSPRNEGINHPLVEAGSNIKPVKPRPLINLCREIELVAYCLMPNHFHLLLKQITKDGITKLMRALTTVYAMYFNRKYNRVGTLFQGKYKAALIAKDSYLLHLSRYIHLNPLGTGSDPVLWPYSSYPYFLGLKKTDWVKPEIVLKFFEKPDNSPIAIAKFQTYKDFVEAGIENPKEGIEKLILEDE